MMKLMPSIEQDNKWSSLSGKEQKHIREQYKISVIENDTDTCTYLENTYSKYWLLNQQDRFEYIVKSNVGKYTCIICATGGSSHGAKLCETMRMNYEFEQTSSNYGVRCYCTRCRKFTTHYKLLSLNPKETCIVRHKITKPVRDRILELFDNKDNYTCGHVNSLQIDHRKGIMVKGYDNDPNDMTDEQLKKEYQLLSSNNNTLKRNACAKCMKTHVQPDWMGLKFNNDNQEPDCNTCPWSYPELYRDEINKTQIKIKKENKLLSIEGQDECCLKNNIKKTTNV